MKTDPNRAIPFDALLEKIPSGILRQSLGKAPRSVFVNRALCRMLGYSAKELLALEPNKIFFSRRTYDSVLKKICDGKSLGRREVSLRGSQGNRISAVMEVEMSRSAVGRSRCLDFIFETPADSGQVEKDLANSREMFKTVFKNSPVAILVTDSQQHIVAWNPFAQTMLNMDWASLFNKPLKDLFSPQEWERFQSFPQKTRKGVLADVETEVVTNDGSSLDVSLSLSGVRNAQGDVIGTIGIMHDVSSQKKAHDLLLASKRAAEAASEAKTMFLANMSHEVRTPMNTILGMVGLTLDTDLTSEQRDNLLTVKNAADILLSLLNDILDLSRVEAGKIQLEDIEIDIERTVQSVCKTMDILAHNKGLILRWVVDEAVPDMVKGDPVRLRQILVNLINNAIKFTKEGKIQVEVKVRQDWGDRVELLFSVSDDGIGIEKDKQDAIFDVFTQEDVSTTRQFGGTGLGLSICKKLLELMHGRIWVESEKNHGSTFFFTVPYVVVHKDDVPQALQEESIESQLMAQISRQKVSDHAPSQARVLHILLAEDNLVNQKMTQRILEKKGWKVSVANNGQEVLDMMNDQSFDLILMDAQMPVMDGLESTRRIRQKEHGTERRIPIVALTARAMEGDRKKCLEAGMDSYVSKPIEREHLFEAIQSFFTL